MTSRQTARAFDLPDHLAVKEDPALIAGDEAHFAAIADSLEQTIADLTSRLDAARLVAGESYTETLERDQEVHRISTRLRTLRRFGIDLCLGRMVPADPRAEASKAVYVGRLGLSGSNGQRLLVDWLTRHRLSEDARPGVGGLASARVPMPPSGLWID